MIEGPVVSGMWIQSHTDFTPTTGSIVLFLGPSVCDARQVNLTSGAQVFSFFWQGCSALLCGVRTVEGMKCGNTGRQPRLLGQQILVWVKSPPNVPK